MKQCGGMSFVAGLESTNVTFTYVLLARIQACDHTQLQGMLGNVVQERKWLGETYSSLHHSGCVFVDACVASGMSGKVSVNGRGHLD